MTKDNKIACLGKAFASEDERREYFRNELRKKLPELKKIEGFPIGEDEDILNLSDPPYYTACPNPWLNDFIEEWEKEKLVLEQQGKRISDSQFKVDEPYASDVSEGKNNPIYNAHSYHTKVPHPAIMRYILHYTQPGDIVFDGFAGTGMTGVAAQMCAKPDSELEYRIEMEFKNGGLKPPQWGARKAICGDLSPIASFISYNYNTPNDVLSFETEAKRILEEVEKECGWMYETKHTNGQSGKINYVVWSDVFVCPNCGGEIVFWDAAVDKEAGKVNDEFACNHCKALLTKRSATKAKTTLFDKAIGETVNQTKTIPVLIKYTFANKRFEKKPDRFDFELIQKINEMNVPYWFPADKIPKGDKTGEPLREGITHVHHFYTKRNLWVLSRCNENFGNKSHLKILLTSILNRSTQMNRIHLKNYFFGGGGWNAGYLKGTLYISSIPIETSVFEQIDDRIKSIGRALSWLNPNSNPVYNSSCIRLAIINDCVDYIFTDPPFGANIMYSELNFLWESWLKVKTNNKTEAIENKAQGKSTLDYQIVMTSCFKEYFRILKPGKWMTVEFSNTSAAVWNGIQTALQRAGFIVANVAALDKKQGSFKAVTTTTAVKQDLVISCYKPDTAMESTIKGDNATESVWHFITEHLQHLPVNIVNTAKTTAVIERSPKILYDRMVIFYLMRDLPVPIDVADFQIGLRQKFIERDGMFFTSGQAAEYDTVKSKSGEAWQLSLFPIIYSESDAVEWLKERLHDTPQTYQDIMPDFRKANVATRKGEREIELKTVLEENFIQEVDGSWRIPDMNEAKDREALRTKALLKEFDHYVTELNTPKAKKLKEVRLEALRAGFRSCFDRKEFQTIVTMGDKIPQNLLLEDEQLLMFYDIAKDRV